MDNIATILSLLGVFLFFRFIYMLLTKRKKHRKFMSCLKTFGLSLVVLTAAGIIMPTDTAKTDSASEPETRSVFDADEKNATAEEPVVEEKDTENQEPVTEQETTDKPESEIPEEDQASEEPVVDEEQFKENSPLPETDIDIFRMEGHPAFYGSTAQAHLVWDPVKKGKINFADRWSDSKEAVLTMNGYRQDENNEIIRTMIFDLTSDGNAVSLEEALDIASEYVPYDIINEWYEYKGSFATAEKDTEKDTTVNYFISYALTDAGSDAYYAKEHAYSGTIDFYFISKDMGASIDTFSIQFGQPRWTSSLDRNGLQKIEWHYDFLEDDRKAEVPVITNVLSLDTEETEPPADADTSEVRSLPDYEPDVPAEIPAEIIYTDTATVKEAQTALNALGYNCGTPDGVAGKATAAAVIAYAASKGITSESGQLTESVVAALKEDKGAYDSEHAAAEEESAPLHDYVVNTNNGKLHETYCGSVDQMKASHRKYITMTREEAVSKYDPCKRCNP